MKLSLVMLAGGLGKRLGQITKKVPKALIDISGKPFISRQLDYLKHQGFQNIIICTSYQGDKIRNFVGNGSKFKLNISYSDDGDKLLGTGGCIKKALKKLKENFFILYGDTFLPINFSLVEKAFFEEGKPALMTILKNIDQWDKSNAYFENKRVSYNDFPDEQSFDIADVYEKLSKKKLLAGYEVKERFYEIGSESGLIETIKFFKKEKKV